jgi:hypothetical protein
MFVSKLYTIKRMVPKPANIRIILVFLEKVGSIFPLIGFFLKVLELIANSLLGLSLDLN